MTSILVEHDTDNDSADPTADEVRADFRQHINVQREHRGEPAISFETTDPAALAEKEAGQAKVKKRFRYLNRKEVRELPPPSFLVDGYVIENALNLVWGVYGTYKSFLVLGWCHAMATNTPWHGKVVKQKRVIYIAPEGANGINLRLEAQELNTGVEIDDDMFITIPMPVNFSSNDDVLFFIKEVLEEFGEDCVIVVDTFARCFAGADENNAKDVSTAIGQFDAIREQLGATIILVHHAGKETSKGPRGSITLPSGVDTEFLTELQGEDIVAVQCRKLKDFPKTAPMQLTPYPVANSIVLKSVGAPAGSLSSAMTPTKPLSYERPF